MDVGALSFSLSMGGGAETMTTNQPDPQQPHLTNEPTARPDPPPEPLMDASQLAEDAIEKASAAFENLAGSVDEPVPMPMKDFGPALATPHSSEIGLLGDVDLDVRIELGRTRMLVEDVLKLTPESVVELDKAAGDPVDIYVNGRHVARGEVLVLNENFCVRVSEIIGKGPVPMDPA